MPQTRVKPKAKAQRRAPEPGLMLLGGSPVVLPQGKVTAAAWPEFALALIMEPAPAQLGVWLGRLEERLGVTDAHRAALESRSFSLAQRQEVERREGLEQAARSAQLQGQVRDLEHVERVAKIQASLARARAAAENPAGQSERQQRKAAKVARVQVVALTETAGRARAAGARPGPALRRGPRDDPDRQEPGRRCQRIRGQVGGLRPRRVRRPHPEAQARQRAGPDLHGAGLRLHDRPARPEADRHRARP
jgi:hypothetical protein